MVNPKILRQAHDPFRLTEEHVVPQWKNSSALYNTVDACHGCNAGKNGATLGRFREWFGRPFFSEVLVGSPLRDDTSTSGDGRLTLNFKDLFKQYDDRVKHLIQNSLYHNPELERKLSKIIREAQKILTTTTVP
jgi:hypothetical protein